MDGRISPQRQLSSPSTNDGNIISIASEQEVFLSILKVYIHMCIIGYSTSKYSSSFKR
jgi:type III secretory pathway component EscU